jgi:hypothetical protein
MHRKESGVHTLPNRCDSCGLFKRWEDLITHYVPDTAFSSENQSWRECRKCAKEASV